MFIMTSDTHIASFKVCQGFVTMYLYSVLAKTSKCIATLLPSLPVLNPRDIFKKWII